VAVFFWCWEGTKLGVDNGLERAMVCEKIRLKKSKGGGMSRAAEKKATLNVCEENYRNMAENDNERGKGKGKKTCLQKRLSKKFRGK